MHVSNFSLNAGAIRRPEEVLQELIEAAKSSGGTELEAKLEEAVSKIKRDNALHKQDLEPDIADMTAMLDIWELFPLQFLVMELGFDLDGPSQVRTAARVQKRPRRSAQARAMVAMAELRVELVR
ncbi:hypothetical protein NC651_007581 [Populus alba x Populus x berolinensis]|nr:hypothetical protein NC651_007581 [Populus alba x Populus x berolinensis]